MPSISICHLHDQFLKLLGVDLAIWRIGVYNVIINLAQAENISWARALVLLEHFISDEDGFECIDDGEDVFDIVFVYG